MVVEDGSRGESQQPSSSLRRSLSDTSLASPSGDGSLRSISFRSKINSRSFRKSDDGTYAQSPSKRNYGAGTPSGPSTPSRKEWIIDLNDIELVETMGSGGTGEVWHGLWQGLDVAVKILYRQGGNVFGAPPSPTEGRQAVVVAPKHMAKVERAFEAEVQSLSSLRHPNIVLFLGACRSRVRVMNTSTVEVQYGIVTEHLSGGSIYDHIHRQEWLSTASPRLLHKIVKDITLGMIYLHNEGIIHRDLKSRNILTNNNWRVCVADFGLSRIKENTFYKNDPSSSLIGTPSWMAPELIQGTQYDEKVDVYSFGVVLFELVSGEIPFSRNYGREMNHVRIVYDVVKHGARPIFPDFIPDPAKALIGRCWSQDPRERPSFREILSLISEEGAVDAYFCHARNAHLASEEEILSISARGLSALKASPATTTTTTEGNSANGSARLQGENGKDNGGVSAGEAPRAKKKAFRLKKWIKRAFRKG